MSTIVEFFTATDDAAAALSLPAGPGRAAESLSLGNFDPEEAVIEWECLLADGHFDAPVDAGEPRFVAGQEDDGCVVFALSPRLSAALAEAEQPDLERAAVVWSRRREKDGEIIDGEVAKSLLSGLAALAGTARRRGEGVYCWVA
ncbi:hypothetical protein [Streptomyces nigra]|uniref:hypothetical protein n=1 Tax=Streptomyces nigra TaxID=1827580 RepID=UPI0034488211